MTAFLPLQASAEVVIFKVFANAISWWEEKNSLEGDDMHLLRMKDGEMAGTSHQRHPAAVLKWVHINEDAVIYSTRAAKST